MTKHTPIELTDDELLAVSGGFAIAGVGNAQNNRQSLNVAQYGAVIAIGNGSSGNTNVGNVSFTESFSVSASQSATNSSSGNNSFSGNISF